jgi:hypothetical protein
MTIEEHPAQGHQITGLDERRQIIDLMPHLLDNQVRTGVRRDE